MYKPKIYLAGAIRDGIAKDFEWRENMGFALQDVAIPLSPMAAKKFDPETKRWTLHGLVIKTVGLVKQDWWMVDTCDILVANLSAMAEGYPCIGTLMEVGRISARSDALVYVIYRKDNNHQNATFDLHPFIKQNAAGLFTEPEDAQEFLAAHIPYLVGSRWSVS